MESDEQVREICEKLVANNPKLTRIEIGENEDEGYRTIAEAMKKNATIEEIIIQSDTLSVSAALSLAGAFLVHPKLKKLHFLYLKFAEFGPIALAMHQNKQLNQITLENCCISSNLMKNMRFLLNEDALETLEIVFNCDYQGRGRRVDFAGTLANNKSLKKLDIGNSSEDALFASDVPKEITQMLGVNSNFQPLYLKLYWEEYNSEMISRIAEAAKEHKFLQTFTLFSLAEIQEDADLAIGSMLKNAPALHELDLSYCHIGDEGAVLLSDSLESHSCCPLKKLTLLYNDIGDDSASALAAALRRNNTIEELDLWENDVGDRGASMLAKLVSENKSIVRMNITNNNIGAEGAIAFAEALRTNKTLKDLRLGGNPIGDDRSVDYLNEATSGAFLRALKQNTTLEHLSLSGMYNATYFAKIKSKIQRMVSLNRAGRRILSSPTDVPRSLWPLILAKSSNEPDVMYFFLRENPQLFMKQAVLGKRKRQHSSCTIIS